MPLSHKTGKKVVIGITSQTGLLIFYWFICRIILYTRVVVPFLADKMKKLTSILILFVLILTSFPHADACSAPNLGAAHSGAPGEVNCSGCHSGVANTGPGTVNYLIGDGSFHYSPGGLYTLFLTMMQDDVNQFGFQTTALKNSNNLTAGTLILTDTENTKLLYGNNRVYVGHTVCGADAYPVGSKEWSFQWEAPESDVGDITFYLSSLAANHNHSSYGDDTYVQTITLSPLQSVTLEIDNDEGWNLVGLPLEVENSSFVILFPESIEGTLYSFDDGYNLETSLTQGEGYWLRFDEVGSTTIDGTPINELTISLNDGWNLVSGLSEDISIYSVSDPGSIIIPGTLYGFNEDGYIEADILVPGEGYWVRAFEAGEITLTSGTLAKIAPRDFSLKGKANSLTVNGMDLYFGVKISARDRLSYSLPPKPPSGAFDVRFSGDTKIAMDKAEIEVMSPYETITISYDVIIDAGEHMNWVLTSESGKDFTLESTGEIIVPTEETFTLERKAIIPIAYTLHQNYPNPFNPITSLRYDLPEQEQVTLTVYDMLGREVTQLVNTTQEAGFRSVYWDATDSFGKPVSAGVYLYQIRAGEFVQTKKMVLLK